jgi:hypothetical protein
MAMTDNDRSRIKNAVAHGSSLRDRANVSFERERRLLRALHDVDQNISILKADGTLLVQFVYGGDIHFPYWAPVCTPSGAQISILSPHDHVWHRGLWLVWKYVNGINFWEGPFSDEPRHGAQLVEGIDKISIEENRVRVSFRVVWSANDGSVPLTENRSFVLTLPAADSAWYTLDVSSELTANGEDAVISSVDIHTFDWGGYGGIGFRSSRDISGFTDRLIVSTNRVISREVHGTRGDWAAYCGLRDGSFRKAWAGFALIDHADNPIHPVPFHASAETICYVGTAPARYESFTVARGAPLTFRNRFVCFDGETDTALIQNLYERFI